MGKDDKRSFIENDKYYRGQIVRRYKLPDKPAKYGEVLLKHGEFNPYKAFGNLYNHQANFIKELRQGKDSLLVSTFASGRTTSSLLYALDILFNKQKSVLFVCYDSYEKQLQTEQLRTILKDTNYQWLVDIHDLSFEVNGSIDEYFSVFPVIAVVEAKDLHGHLLPNHPEYSDLFESLGLIIVDDLDKYSGLPSSNLHGVIKRTKKVKLFYSLADETLQFLVTSKSFYENEGITNQLFERNFSTVYGDSRELKGGKLFFWVPAFTKNRSFYEQKADERERVVIRESVIDDAYILAYQSVANEHRTVLYYSGLPISESDISKRERFNEVKGIDIANDDLIIGNDLGDISAKIVQNGLSWNEIDTIVVACLSDSPVTVRDEMIHLGKNSCEIFLLMPQTPSYQFFINNPGHHVVKDVEQIVSGERSAIFSTNPSHKSIEEKHKHLQHLEFQKVINNPKYHKNFDDVADEFTYDKNHMRFCLSTKGLDFYSSDYRTSFKIIDQQDVIIRTVQQAEIPDFYFRNSVIVVNGNRYLVQRVDIDEKEISVSKSTEKPDFKIGMPDFTIHETIHEEEKNRSFNINNIVFSARKLTVSSSFNRYRIYEKDPNVSQIVSSGGDNSLKNYDLDVISVDGIPEEIIHGFSNLFISSLKSRVVFKGHTPKYFIHDNKLYIYNVGSFQNSSILLQDSIIKDLLTRCIQIVIDCPCRSGCPGCLEVPEFNAIQLDKRRLMEFLQELDLQDREIFSKSIKWKFNTIGEAQGDSVKLRKMRDQALKVLSNKAGINIENLYDEKFMNRHDAQRFTGASGVCAPGEESIYLRTSIEENLISTIAHEYVHNWQHEGNFNHKIYYKFDYKNIEGNYLWFGGKIFSEGQANWAASKVMDYYGIRRLMFEDEYSSGEYRYGFILLNRLEMEYGLQKLINLLKTGELNGDKINKKTIEGWYDKYGIKSLVEGEIKDRIDKEELVCLSPSYLNKRNDFNRYTYHLSYKSNSCPKLKDLLGKTEKEREKNGEIVWGILKEHFEIVPNKSNDELPCLNCAFFEQETLDGMCMLFGGLDKDEEGVSVKEKILNAVTEK